MPAPSLLVLAAGMGSRYGGLKQIEPVGPSGETLLDYAVFDALRAGFGRVVFVIRRDIREIFREKVGARYADRAPVDYVFQELEDLPAGFRAPSARGKPWGTGHAVWCARAAVAENFAAINADDFYGADSFRQLAAFLRGRPAASHFALVGFELAQTLSEHGTVARGVCEVKGGRLVSIAETAGISTADVGPGRKFSGAEIVSMNCWGFTPALFPALEALLREFLAAHGDDPKSEFYLPEAVGSLVAREEASVNVLSTRASWFGMTHREDKPRVAADIAELVRRGEYPAKLF
jgi:NDP-sugar pyrophosphorylase family protein